jgi:ATP phosphoribosyltransferase regulatory subunit
VLEVSNLDMLTPLLSEIFPEGQVKAALKCVDEKNIHGLDSICAESGVPKEKADPLKELLSIYGRPADVMPQISAFAASHGLSAEAAALAAALEIFAGSELEDRLVIDFSAVSDIKYYNGIVFRGFVNGVPDSVLCGGQYDRLMRRMGRESGAIGFAVYLDMLNYLPQKSSGRDGVDVMLIYGPGESPSAVRKAVAQFTSQGLTVLAGRSPSQKVRYGRLAELKDGRVTIIEDDA